ncbi:putative amidoligase domain-containing protein [Bacillus horti]|uniref:Phage phiEco32-like COOH.NH2 ligase-type 2 n=1 Tax=Caldalkalibacillus horti TaxID=77523 RepID=A0ABT9VV30_9BACI|nr:hypothetical protein [Bacillus horti]MDQ0164819.1 hypothetical protein [Bacillus horti]
MRVYQRPGTEAEKDIEAKILSINGIPRYSSRRKRSRKYRFYIYHFEVIGLFHNTTSIEAQPWLKEKSKQKERWARISANKLSKEVLKAKKLALRTLYILGYDLGMVEVSVHASAPQYTISKIFYHEAVAKELQSQLEKNRKSEEEKSISFGGQTSMLGADLEVALRSTNGKFVLASKYFTKKGRVGHDAIWLKGQRSSYPLVELRPEPSNCPRTLFKNIRSCLKKGVKKVNSSSIQWLAGGCPLKNYPIGGHIHFSKIALTPHFIRVLDNYLALPLRCLESKESIARRPKYGYLGDYREQYHGGFEYRTPPSWITHPRIAKGVLCLAKVLTKEQKNLNWFPLNSEEVQLSFYKEDTEGLYPIVKNVWSQLQATTTYEAYAEELNSFYELIEQRYVWDEFADIRAAWAISPYSAKNMV